MKKTLTLYFIALIGALNVNGQQWNRTNFVTTAPLPIYDIEYHKGAFYATGSVDFITGKVSKYEQETWSNVTINGLIGAPQYIASNDEVIYISTYDLFTGSYLYVSSDNGLTFSLDTAGISKQSTAVSTILSLEIFGNDILVGVSGGYFHKDLSTVGQFTAFTTPTLLNGGTDQVIVDNGKMYAYDNAGALTMYISSDYGSTWTEATNTGLPALISSFMEIDPITKRIFIGGKYESETKFGVYYTDNEGQSWNELDLSSYGLTNFQGGLRTATALDSYNGEIHIALNNDEVNTALDILQSVSTNNEILDYDTTGIFTGAGTVEAIKFARSETKIVVSMNQFDLYIQDLTVTGLRNNIVDPLIYPSPAISTIYAPFKQANAIDLLGNSYLLNFHEGKADISNLPKGIYIVESDGYREKIILE